MDVLLSQRSSECRLPTNLSSNASVTIETWFITLSYSFEAFFFFFFLASAFVNLCFFCLKSSKTSFSYRHANLAMQWMFSETLHFS